MKTLIAIAAWAVAILETSAAEEASPVARWSFEQVRGQTVADAVGKHAGDAKGAPQQVAGVDGQALKFDGGFVSVPICTGASVR